MSATDPMRGWVDSFPEMLAEAWGPKHAKPDFRLPEGRLLLLGGMGGSGMAGALAAARLEQEGRCAIWWRNPELPPWLGPGDGFILTSYSGETWEALAMLDEAMARGTPARVIGSGGRLLARAQAAGVPRFTAPGGLAPRASLPWLLAGVLRAAGGIDDDEIDGAIRLMREEKATPPAGREPGAIADALAGRIAVLLPLGPAMETVALRWRNQILENAKQAAFVSALPEMAHNEVMGWEHLRDAGTPVSFVLLTESAPSAPRRRALVDALREQADREGHPFLEIPAPAGTGKGFAPILSQVYLGDRVSVALADRRGVEATPVPAISRLRDATGKEQSR